MIKYRCKTKNRRINEILSLYKFVSGKDNITTFSDFFLEIENIILNNLSKC